MGNKRRARGFRPSLDGRKLEDRVVLNAAHPHVAAAFGAGAGFTNRQILAQEALQSRLIMSAFRNQVRLASNNLRGLIGGQLAQLYANGTPTAQQLADFNAMTSGMLDATAFQLSSQAALFPGSSRLVAALQNSILGNAPNSLANRISLATQSGLLNANPGRINSFITRAVNQSFANNSALVGNFFNTTPVNRLAVNQAGQIIPLQQFMGNQIVNQLGNTLGGLSQGFGNLANSTLFANGQTAADAATLTAFQNMGNQALSTAAFQLGSDVALFPFFSTGIAPQLQNALFANTPNSLFVTLRGLPNSSTQFGTAASTAFNTGFQNLVTPLNSFFNLPTTTTTPVALSSGPFTSVFGPSFTTFGNGFNNGFGTGFLGFGTPLTGFNTNFGTGFNNVITGANTNFGFAFPTVNTPPIGVPGTGSTFGTGTGTTVGTGTGTVTIGSTGSTTLFP